MTVLEKKTKGSYHYLHSCGREEQLFYPFSYDVPTTLRVKRVVDRMYNVRHHYSSKEKSSKTPKLAVKALGGNTEAEKALAQQRDYVTEQKATPTCCTYNPVDSSKFMDQYGQIKIRFGTEPRLMRTPIGLEPPTDEAITGTDSAFPVEPRKPQKSHQHVQMTNRPPKHIPGSSFARSLPTSKSLRKRRLEKQDGKTVKVIPQSPPKTKASLHPHGISPELLVPGIAMGGGSHIRGGMSRTPRKTMGHYWSTGSEPSTARVEPPSKSPSPSALSYSHRDRHVPTVSMNRSSGRELYNGAKQNVSALEKLLKKVSQEQALLDKKADAWTYQSTLFGNNKNKGVDIWMIGSRHDRAVQGVCSGADNLSSKWVIEEVDSINRVQAASRASESSPRSVIVSPGPGPGPASNNNNNETNSYPTRATAYRMKLRSEIGASAAAAAADADYVNTLKAVDNNEGFNLNFD